MRAVYVMTTSSLSLGVCQPLPSVWIVLMTPPSPAIQHYSRGEEVHSVIGVLGTTPQSYYFVKHAADPTLNISNECAVPVRLSRVCAKAYIARQRCDIARSFQRLAGAGQGWMSIMNGQIYHNASKIHRDRAAIWAISQVLSAMALMLDWDIWSA